MKIRNGFVSNSSSSSFIIVGFKISKEEYYSKIDKNGTIYDEQYYHPHLSHPCGIYLDDGYLVGKVLESGEKLDIGSYSIDDINNIVYDISTKYGVDKSEIRLHFGTTES